MNSERTGSRLRAGDLVVVRTPLEILTTLDSNGTLDNLPFMPEMLEYCGNTFRVSSVVVQASIDGAFLGCHTESFVREFKHNDVVTLQGLRCSGKEHDACQRNCSIFWKQAWLKKVADHDNVSVPDGESIGGAAELRAMMKTKTDPSSYFCQSSEFLKATLNLSSAQRFEKCFSAVAAGNISAWAMTKRIVLWMVWKARTRLIGEHGRGPLEKTPTEVLNLQPGELVQVKSLGEIIETLDSNGRNRGLHFSGDQRRFCGGTYRVRSRADNFIAEGTGEMKHFRNTVMLEDVLCDSAYFAFGGCYRADMLYWREIWLRRADPSLSTNTSEIEQVCLTN